MLVYLSVDAQKKINEARAKFNESVNEAVATRNKHYSDANELYVKAQQIEEDAEAEYSVAVVEARNVYNKTYNEIIKESYESQKIKSRVNVDEPHKLGRDAIKDPMMRLLYDILTSSGAFDNDNNFDKEVGKTEEKEMSVEEKIKYINEKLEELSEKAKAYVGLTDAKVVQVRNEHECEFSQKMINTKDFAVVTHLIRNSKQGVTSKNIIDSNGDIQVNTSGKMVGITPYETIELHKYRCWITLDSAIEAIKKAKELKF